MSIGLSGPFVFLLLRFSGGRSAGAVRMFRKRVARYCEVLLATRFFSPRKVVVLCSVFLCLVLFSLVLISGRSSASGQTAELARAADPWTPGQTIEPAA